MENTGISYKGDRSLAIHPLVYFADGDEVTIGRPDIDSYGIFPLDGAELVRHLADGTTPDEAARWYEAEYGETPNVEHIVAALDELGFIREAGEPLMEAGPIRWQRLGKIMFSPIAWIAYCFTIFWAILIMAHSPTLIPRYHDLFFSKYFSIIELVLLIGAIPLILLHETFHALAARRLGLRSRLSISQRLYYIVAETAMDGLVVISRRKRYLPILAGMLADIVVLAVLIIVANFSRNPDGVASSTEQICLAFAFAIFLRILWQFFFYVRTDLYVLVSTVLGCVDLHTTSMRLLGNRIKRLLGLREKLTDESDWHPVDRRVARWYSWLILGGYLVSLSTLIFAVGPVAVHMFSGAFERFAGDTSVSGGKLLDSVIFVGFNLAQIALTVWLAMRARAQRRKSHLQHVIA